MKATSLASDPELEKKNTYSSSSHSLSFSPSRTAGSWLKVSG